MTTTLADPTFVLDLTSLDSSMIRLVGGKVADAPIPPGLARGLAAAYAALSNRSGESGESGVAVAVRSSATAEDLPTASFAGQQDSYLNVVGTGAVLAAVHRCWASLWTDRAVSYRAVNGIDQATVQLAVVVQRMVEASVAGVLFTADPVTGPRHRAVVDSTPGLGEAVVSGAVNPDRFVVDTETSQILERRLGDKRVAVRSPARWRHRAPGDRGQLRQPQRHPAASAGGPRCPGRASLPRAAGHRVGSR